MNCERTDDLLEEFVLGTLLLEEEGGIRSHVTNCRRHDDALTELQAVIDRLAVASPDLEPPTSVRSGLLERFVREADQPGSAGPALIRAGGAATFRRAFARYLA